MVSVLPRLFHQSICFPPSPPCADGSLTLHPQQKPPLFPHSNNRTVVVILLQLANNRVLLIIPPLAMSHHNLPPTATPPYMYPPDHPYWTLFPPYNQTSTSNNAYLTDASKSISRYPDQNHLPPPIPPRPTFPTTITPTHSVLHSTLNVKLMCKSPGLLTTISSSQPEPRITVVEDKDEEHTLPAENKEDELEDDILDDLQAERDDDWPQIGLS